MTKFTPMFSSDKDYWETPQNLFDELNAEFNFTLDAAASDVNHKCKRYFTKKDNGLLQDWQGETVFCNPPYGNRETGQWTEKCYREAQKPNTTVVLLIPARTDRSSFHEYILGKAEIRFIRGRLKFEIEGKPMHDRDGHPLDAAARTTKGGRMKRLTFRTDMGDDLLDAIAFINPDDAEGLYNLRDIAEHGSDELLYEIANRLAEYEDMEEQGLLLKLPCKMGDKLWIIVTKRPRVYSPEFSFVKASKLTWNNLQQVLKGLKKTVFTSREAAERALEDA